MCFARFFSFFAARRKLRCCTHPRRTSDPGRTDGPLLQGDAFTAGTYQLTFHVGAYFAGRSQQNVSSPPFLDQVPIRVTLNGTSHYHVPLLCSPWSYSTYRGS